MTASQSELERRLRRVELRLAVRRAARGALSGLALGTAVGAALFAAAWLTRIETLRSAAPLASLLGGLVGAGRTYWQRFSRAELGLFLDARLGSAEVITTALLSPSAEPTDAARAVEQRAVTALASANPQRLRLPIGSRLQLLLLPALGLAYWLQQLPPRSVAAAAVAPGAAKIRKDVRSLERIEALSEVAGVSEQDRERMRQLAAEAKKLRSDLKRGLEQREAQARLATLRDQLRDARELPGSQAERAGLQAALSALGAQKATERAAKALGQGDLIGFDEEMQRAADSAEQSAREAARQALAEAERAAGGRGAPRLAEQLARALQAFDARAEKSRALREFAKALAPKLDAEGRAALEEFLAQGGAAAAQRLAEALAQALEQLSEDERARLAERLKSQLAQDPSAPHSPSREELATALEQLTTEAGKRRLAQMLRELARAESADERRQRALQDAERGGADAERELRGLLPLPGPGGPGGDAPDKGANAGQGQAPSNDASRGKHDGSTARVEGDGLRARASARMLPGASLPASGFDRTPGRAGETANQVGTDNISGRAAKEVGAVEHADVPEQYREHVGRYFEP